MTRVFLEESWCFEIPHGPDDFYARLELRRDVHLSMKPRDHYVPRRLAVIVLNKNDKSIDARVRADWKRFVIHAIEPYHFSGKIIQRERDWILDGRFHLSIFFYIFLIASFGFAIMSVILSALDHIMTSGAADISVYGAILSQAAFLLTILVCLAVIHLMLRVWRWADSGPTHELKSLFAQASGVPLAIS